MPSFVELVREEVELSLKIIDDHSHSGENETIPIDKMFPHGLSDIAFMIFTKAARLIGYEIHGNLDKVQEEARDLINYCGFLLAFFHRGDW